MSGDAPTTVRTRFAPSPSGHLHVGGARTALFGWAYARGRGGQFILRIEDTDRKRSSDAASLAFLEDLAWLGIDWDEGPEHPGSGGGSSGPYFQSQRLDLYQRYAEHLIETGQAYRAFETPDELQEARARARAEKRTYRYDRAALDLDADLVRRYLDEGRPHVVRFKVPEGVDVRFQDEVFGAMCVSTAEMDDFVILKADGFPTYHFAVVIDDELMAISHVIRGQEHLNNTVKHVLLQEALGFKRPVYAHVSLIVNPDGSKMSKRDQDKFLRQVVRQRGVTEAPANPETGAPAIDAQRWAWWVDAADHQLEPDEARRLAHALDVEVPAINVDDFRRAGYEPDVLVNYLALLGWSPGQDVETFDRAFLVERFDLDRIIKSPAKFDRDKLLAFNLDAIQEMSEARFADGFRAHLHAYHPEFIQKLSDAQITALAQANHGRCKTFEDPIRSCRFFIADDDAIVYERSKAVRKALVSGDPAGYDHLEAMLPLLRDLADWSAGSLERVITDYAEARAGGRLGKVAQPLRIAVSGSTISPAIFDTLAILGRESVLSRIAGCLAQREMLSQA